MNLQYKMFSCARFLVCARNTKKTTFILKICHARSKTKVGGYTANSFDFGFVKKPAGIHPAFLGWPGDKYLKMSQKRLYVNAILSILPSSTDVVYLPSTNLPFSCQSSFVIVSFTHLLQFLPPKMHLLSIHQSCIQYEQRTVEHNAKKTRLHAYPANLAL